MNDFRKRTFITFSVVSSVFIASLTAFGATATYSNSDNSPTSDPATDASVLHSSSIPAVEESVDIQKLKKEYADISDINSLKEFRDKAKQKFNNVNTANEYYFTLTFNEPVNQDVLRKFNLGIDQAILYGRGIDKNEDRITIGVNGFDQISIAKLQYNAAFNFKGFIQISGKAKGDILKKLSEENEVFSVEVATDGYVPFGLFWKLEDTIMK